jgi:Sec-independent protein translocase protein TatA
LESLGADLERALKEVRNGVARVQQEQQTPAEEEPVMDTPAGG